MKVKLLGAVVFAALMLSQASAATLMGPSTDALGIQRLDINGDLYDVRFVHQPFNSIWTLNSDNLPIFWGDKATATAATTAIFNFLNDSRATGLAGIGAGTLNDIIEPFCYSCDFFTGFILGTLVQGGIPDPTTGQFWSDGGCCIAIPPFGIPAHVDYAVITRHPPTHDPALIANPLPPAGLLFGSALMGLSLLGLRTRRRR
jgi:hypothetical protein